MEAKLRAAVLESLGTVAMKPNKLRKVVVSATDCDWTAFATALTSLQDDGTIEETTIDDAVHVRAAGSDAAARASTTPAESVIKRESTSMALPLAIAQHLRRKSRRKLKNIETATKTRIRLAPFVDGGKSSARGTAEEVEATIRAESLAVADDEARRRIDAAVVFLKKMRSAFDRHPERFEQQAGGTVQAQEKKHATQQRKELKHKKRPLPPDRGDAKKAAAGLVRDDAAPTKVARSTEAADGPKRKKKQKFF